MPLLPLFSRALLEMGTTRRSYVDLGSEVAAQTGGMGAYPSFMTSQAGRKPVSYFMVSGKANLDRVGASPIFSGKSSWIPSSTTWSASGRCS